MSRYDTVPAGDLLDPFSEEGAESFTARFACSQGAFCGINGDDRESFFDVTFAAVPLPPALALMGAGLAALALLRRRG